MDKRDGAVPEISQPQSPVDFDVENLVRPKVGRTGSFEVGPLGGFEEIAFSCQEHIGERLSLLNIRIQAKPEMEVGISLRECQEPFELLLRKARDPPTPENSHRRRSIFIELGPGGEAGELLPGRLAVTTAERTE
jgi:hypothetical protein